MIDVAMFTIKIEINNHHIKFLLLKFQAILSIIPSSDTNCIEGTYEFHIRSHIRNGNHISKTDNEKVNFNNSKIFYMILKRQNID
ncbi:unnamed protein product [Rotaria sp. Silwood1]|nr:unnamed protein product [Rotaria sp. Silwood1]CAF1617483.1 unnamed protein product [Rotaria sp. Silwood1]CAF3745897.1 unnamed protein product [Rotaria sp. Silwood1]CAF3942067.1 unnamed protein product [Rotaria sp. Silwood1]CAF4698763.1 unnamed protein product [Rotaria sp. Silwood1]